MYSKFFKKILGVAGAVAVIAAFSSCVFINNVRLTDSNKTFDSSDFTKIDADINWGEFKLTSSDDENVYVTAEDVPDTFKAEIQNGVLIVDFNTKSSVSMPRAAKTSVIIKVPVKNYERLDLDFGAGNSTIEDFTCSKMDIDCGAGKLEVKNVTTDSQVKLDGGAGSIKFSQCILGGLNAELGVGEFTFSGTINGNISIECGVGNATLNLENPKSDFDGANKKYSLKTEGGIGKIKITYKD